MINAHEARKIVDLSDKSVDTLMESLDSKIRANAALGGNVYKCNCNKLSYTSMSNQGDLENNPARDIQNRIIEKLKNLGYMASMENDGLPYVPRAYEDYEVAPTAQYVRLKITW
jgi:hypothetical protein